MPTIQTERPFVVTPPSPQNAIDLFAGEWASRFPATGPRIEAGNVPLFEDPRFGWADGALRQLSGQGFAGQRVLELGPLEGGHTYMLAQLGAREVVAVEANARAYLKCLVAREVLNIPHARFLLGDALGYMRTTEERFDVGVACGFLYHMIEPVETIALLARCCRQVFIWTVFHDESLFVKQPALAPQFGPPRAAEFGGFAHTLFPQFYGDGIDYRKFRGGVQPSCCWMKSDEILGALRHFGFTALTSHEEENPYGKAIAVAAVKP
ncbi:MAG TPA: class I SAM-dependent methyltransferase [Opitutaceae bacterium]|nr:class I SAM-dependent methyltransferase [Opitutaceae bacterium]